MLLMLRREYDDSLGCGRLLLTVLNGFIGRLALGLLLSSQTLQRGLRGSHVLFYRLMKV